MKKLYFVIGFIAGVVTPFLSFSVVTAEETVSLLSLIEEAQRNNPELEALHLDQEGAKEEIIQAPFLDDPQLTLTQRGLGIEQAFPYPGKRSLKREIATLDWEMAQQEYQAKQLEISAEIKSAYYNLSFIYKTIDLHQEHQGLLTQFIKIAEKKYAIGQSTQQDLLKTEVELAKLHNGRMTLEQDILATKAKINALINQSDSYPIGRPEDITYRPFPFLYAKLIEEAVSLQHGLRRALFRVEKNEAMKNLTKKAKLPDFMLGVTYVNLQQAESEWMLMGKMNLPWVFWEKYSAKNRKAVLDEDMAKASYNALKNETLAQIKIIFTKIKTDEQLIDSYQNRLIPLAKQSLEVAQIGYQSGKTDFLNFIDSERTLLDLQIEYYMTLTDYWQQVAMLSPLIGKEINP